MAEITEADVVNAHMHAMNAPTWANAEKSLRLILAYFQQETAKEFLKATEAMIKRAIAEEAERQQEWQVELKERGEA